MADPAFLSSFYSDADLKEHFFVDGVVCVLDAKHVSAHLKKGRVIDNLAQHHAISLLHALL